MEDQELVADVASQMITQYGDETPAICRDNAAADDQCGDTHVSQGVVRYS